MLETKAPYIHSGQGDIPPDQRSEPQGWAIFGMRALLRPYNDLVALNWSWNFKDYLTGGHPDRLGQWYSGLHDMMPYREYHERTFCIRYIQKGTGEPLKNMVLTRVVGEPGAILDVAKQSWHEVSSGFPYDYILEPIGSEQELLEETGQAWVEKETRNVSISILQPAIGILNSFSGSASNPIPVLGKWSATTTSSENTWRALHNYPHPVLMDILLRPTVLRNDELVALDSILIQLERLVENEDHPVVKIQAQQYLAALSRRVQNLIPSFVMQVRLASPQIIYPYLLRIVGTALTYQSIASQNEPFQGYQAKIADQSQTADWAHKIASLDFIDSDVPVHPSLKRFPMIVSAVDLPFIARFFLTPKGGISNLHLEEP